MLVQEYIEDNTKIRVHNDFCTKDNELIVKNVIISLLTNNISQKLEEINIDKNFPKDLN